MQELPPTNTNMAAAAAEEQRRQQQHEGVARGIVTVVHAGSDHRR